MLLCYSSIHTCIHPYHVRLLCIHPYHVRLRNLTCSGAHVLVLSNGGAAPLALAAAAAGARSVVCVESSALAFRMSSMVMRGNKHIAGCEVVKVKDARLQGLCSRRINAVMTDD